MSVVILHVYDLSGGLAATWSPVLLGVQIEAIYHTGVVVHQREYYFGGGIQQGAPGQTPYGRPWRALPLGETFVDVETLHDFLVGISGRYRVETYDLLTNNCNHFADELCRFLVGKGIPSDILQLPRRVLDTPLGPLLRQLMRPVEFEPASSNLSLPEGSGLPPATSQPESGQPRTRDASRPLETTDARAFPARSSETALLAADARPHELASAIGNDAVSSSSTAFMAGPEASGHEQQQPGLVRDLSSGEATAGGGASHVLPLRGSLGTSLPFSRTPCCCRQAVRQMQVDVLSQGQAQMTLAREIAKVAEQGTTELLQWLCCCCSQCAGCRAWMVADHALFWQIIAKSWHTDGRSTELRLLLDILATLLQDETSARLLLATDTDPEWIRWLVHALDPIPHTERQVWVQAGQTLQTLGRAIHQLVAPSEQEHLTALLLWEFMEDLEVWGPALQSEDEIGVILMQFLEDLFRESPISVELGRSMGLLQALNGFLPASSCMRLRHLLDESATVGNYENEHQIS